MSRRDVLKQSAAVAAACAAGLGVAGCGRRAGPARGGPTARDRRRHRRDGPAFGPAHDERGPAAALRSAPPQRAGSARWAPASRRKAPWPGPASSTARGRARTASSTSSTGIPRQQCAPFFSGRRDPAAAKAAGTSATTGSNCRSGRSTTSRRPPCCGGRACPSGTTSTSAASRPRFTTCPPTTRPARRSTATTAACAGMGTPDMLGTYGTYQYLCRRRSRRRPASERRRQAVAACRSRATRPRPGWWARKTPQLKDPQPVGIDFSCIATGRPTPPCIELPDRKVLLKAGHWSPWIKLDFRLSRRRLLPTSSVSGICRFYLQEVAPNFRLYVTPDQHRPLESGRADFRARRLRPGDFRRSGAVLHHRVSGRPQGALQRRLQRRRVHRPGRERAGGAACGCWTTP